jgi:hypothetical protein
MLRRMIVKEWKEKSGLLIFALAVFVLFSVAFSAYANDPDTLDWLTSTLVLIFPAVFALLVGASGFASEFRDGAWAYLFSRPVKKWWIWLTKYISLLTILYAAILVMVLIIRFHPAIESARSSFNFSLVGDKSYILFVLILPLFLFTASYSLSVVSDRSFSVLFVATLIFLALPIAASIILEPLLYRGGIWLPLSAKFTMFALLSLSFVPASLITLGRADFSQPRNRAWLFTKFAAAGFVMLLVLTTLFVFGSGKLRNEMYLSSFEARDDGFYFVTNKGVFKFDTAEGRTGRIARHRPMWGGISLGDDKIVFVTYQLGGKRSGFAEIRIMNSDGKNEHSLLETWNPESPLYGADIYPFRLSPRGDKVVFIARHLPKKESPELWVINGDGSGLKGYNLGITDAEFYRFIRFGESGETLYLLYTTKIKPGDRDQRAGAKLLRVDLESGNEEILAEQIRRSYAVSITPRGRASGTGLIAYLQADETGQKEVLTILNPETLDKKDVWLEDSVTAFRWSSGGDKLAFMTAGAKIGVYSPTEQIVVKTRELKGYDLRWPWEALEWTADGRLILRKREGEASYICLLGPELEEQKAMRLPFSTRAPSRIWSAGEYAFVENSKDHQLWGVDLATEKWLRIY